MNAIKHRLLWLVLTALVYSLVVAVVVRYLFASSLGFYHVR